MNSIRPGALPGAESQPGLKASNGLLSVTICEAAEQARMQPWISMECYQLKPGQQLTRMDTLNLGDQQLVRERQAVAVQKLGRTPANLCTISCCTPDPTFRFSAFCAAQADRVFFMPGNTDFDIYVPNGADTTYISLDQDSFLDGARALNPAGWDRAPSQLLSVPTSGQATLTQLFRETTRLTASATRFDPSTLSKALLQGVLLLTATSAPDSWPPPPLERARALAVCRLARAYIDDCLLTDTLPSIADVCAAIGVSERTLQYAFRRYVDMAPLAYLGMCRLSRVHSALLAADPQSTTVTALAMRFGFLHLGRFAVNYKRTFGESPSVTLSR